MSCILTRTTGRTSPNTKRPSRGSNNSRDCHCVKKERSNEIVSRRIFVGFDWKRRSCHRPRWIVAALSRCETHDGHGNQNAKFHLAGFASHTPRIDRSAAGSGADLSATVAEYWCENGQGRTEIGRRRDSHHRQRCRGRKTAGLRPSTVFRLYPESVCRCHVPIRPKRAAAIHSLQ